MLGPISCHPEINIISFKKFKVTTTFGKISFLNIWMTVKLTADRTSIIVSYQFSSLPSGFYHKTRHDVLFAYKRSIARNEKYEAKFPREPVPTVLRWSLHFDDFVALISTQKLCTGSHLYLLHLDISFPVII